MDICCGLFLDCARRIFLLMLNIANRTNTVSFASTFCS